MSPDIAMAPQYVYRAIVTKITDGDTIQVLIDLGFEITTKRTIRLYGIDTPERGQAGYREASARVSELIPVGSSVVIRSYKADERDKYGRYLAWVTTGTVDVCATMLEEHLAVPYFGGTKGVIPST